MYFRVHTCILEYLDILNIQLTKKETTVKYNKLFVKLSYVNDIKIEGKRMDPAC